jgi:hypothetical protein
MKCLGYTEQKMQDWLELGMWKEDFMTLAYVWRTEEWLMEPDNMKSKTFYAKAKIGQIDVSNS